MKYCPYNKPFYKDVLGITYSKIHETELRWNEARYNKNPRYDEQNPTCLVYSFVDTPTWPRLFLAISDVCRKRCWKVAV